MRLNQGQYVATNLTIFSISNNLIIRNLLPKTFGGDYFIKRFLFIKKTRLLSESRGKRVLLENSSVISLKTRIGDFERNEKRDFFLYLVFRD